MGDTNNQATMGELSWPTHPFEYGPVKGLVERQTVQHSIQIARVLAILPDAATKSENFHRSLFARMIAQTVEVEGLAFELPDPLGDEQPILEAYEQFTRMDGWLFDAWYAALARVDEPPNAREFWPSHKLTDDERKNRLSAGSPTKTTSGAPSKPTTGTEATEV